jgi:hypothetical protein
VASDRYTPQQLADMARRLDECIEVSALCMDLALAGEIHRRAPAQASPANAKHPADETEEASAGSAGGGEPRR